jgi:hypothetical protein
VGDDGDSKLDINEDYSEGEDGECECGGDGCEDGDRSGQDEEEREDYTVDRVEECHFLYRGREYCGIVL